MYRKPILEVVGDVRGLVLGMYGEGSDFNGQDYGAEFDFLSDGEGNEMREWPS